MVRASTWSPTVKAFAVIERIASASIWHYVHVLGGNPWREKGEAINPLQTALLKLYSAVRKSGILDTGIGQTLFRGAYFAYKKHLEDPYDALARRHPAFFRGGNILDVGANIGYCSVVFAKAIDPAFRVYAFEPEPCNFRLLLKSIQKHQVASFVEPHQAAVGASDGTVELWLNVHHHADHRVLTVALRKEKGREASVTVPLIQIDNFVESRTIRPISFIKVDVQGYESAVCAGMERTLLANPDCVLSMEWMPEAMKALGFRPKDLLEWCKNQQLRAYPLSRDGTIGEQIHFLDGVALSNRGYGDLLFSRRELH
jgi:FkbM family methyltransferase